jgi:5-oxopent-3-ene-1,2,5-tricarboxylate decarboxylase / 2-hydroxyhepta-2,4-diene-1,7-dioate isomerase
VPDPVSDLLGRPPGKVVGVHLNYRSRAAQRGRTPAFGSYFLKAPSSLGAGGAAVARPQGTELLGFEGEIALVIGNAGRDIAAADGWTHVGWVTAANDLGLYDLRHADRGSNLRSKSLDGYTPLGPRLIPAGEVDPSALRVRTWVNGRLVQCDDSSTLLFGFAELVADLSRGATLERGDVILTGTPAGASVVVPGDVVEVEVDSIAPDRPASTGRLRTPVVDGPPWTGPGAGPRVDDALRAHAWGHETGEVPDATLAGLGAVAVATISAQLRRRGLDQVSVDGVHPLRPGSRFCGHARTLRFLPLREDLVAAHAGGLNAQKRAIDTVGRGEVLVMEARGEPGTGTVGDILALRAQVRGAAAIVTDGGVRDAAAVAALDIPVFCGGAHPAVLGRRHVPWEVDVAIGCGGTTVLPGDILVGDDDGVVVVPPALAAQVLADAVEQERQERFITEQVRAGRSVDGLYPLGPAWRERYAEWCGQLSLPPTNTTTPVPGAPPVEGHRA